MRIVFVRHGEPDYGNDCLTPAGRIQALAAAERLGYRIVFLLHPVLSAQLDDFNAPAGVEICASVKI